MLFESKIHSKYTSTLCKPDENATTPFDGHPTQVYPLGSYQTIKNPRKPRNAHNRLKEPSLNNAIR